MGLLIGILAIGLAWPALAKDLKTSAGQPLCADPDQLQEYMLAGIKGDAQWMKELDCAPMKAGAKVVIIQELPSNSEIMHVVKVRVFGAPGMGSTVGYTINLGLN